MTRPLGTVLPSSSRDSKQEGDRDRSSPVGGPEVQGVSNASVTRMPQRRGGEKLAFEPETRGFRGNDEALVARVKGVIDGHQDRKRAKKVEIEEEREHKIEWIEGDVKAKGAASAYKDEEKRTAAYKKILADYHERVQQEAGWRWVTLKDEILRAVKGVEIYEVPDQLRARVYGPAGSLLYTVYFDENRFESRPDPATDGGTGAVFTKKGYKKEETGAGKREEGPPEAPKSKQFIKDANGVHTRRYVTRAVTIYHLASLVGVKFSPRPGATAQDAPEVEEAFKDDGSRLDEQVPRYTKLPFGAHGDTFNLGRAAGVVQPGEAGNRDLTPYLRNTYGTAYASADGTIQPILGRRGDPIASPRIGGKSQLPIFTAGMYRPASDPMRGNERASMQVRNGSGPTQPYLSTASTQIPGRGRYQKIIRANKGERFDTGAENQATLEIDLAKAQKLGVDIVNQHSKESHKHKMAYERYYDKGDLDALVKKVKAKLDAHVDAEQIKKDFAGEIKGWKYSQVWNLVNGYGRWIDHKELPAKRSAADELDEYIYSAEKNREVLMDRIPLSCVTRIRLSEDPEKWPQLPLVGKVKPVDRERFPGLWVGAWLDATPKVVDSLKKYLVGDSDAGYKRLKEMFVNAAVQKEKEGANRT